MAEPFRDKHHACPACNQPLREYMGRLVCDACEGMFLSLEALATAIHDMTSVVPELEFKDEEPGKRPCPHCGAAMSTLKLRVMLEAEMLKPKPELDRCAVHGIWFDGAELAKVFEKVAGKGYGGGVGRKIGAGPRVPTQNHGWSAVFKKFGGRGGW